ncbi:MAG: methionyl-tRNA formyltransferase [Solirubrobacterales bacterium]
MRVAFLGTADFSVPSLSVCARQAEVVAVITQPDRAGSRGRPAPRPVADAARDLGLSLLQPERLRDPTTTDAILGLGLDALVVAAYGQILPARLLDGVPLGGINVHASLLPRWRGAAPVAAAILAGDGESGVSIMRMDAGIDTGAVFAMRSVPVAPDATTPALTAALADLGAELLGEVLPAIELGEVVAVPQTGEGATHAPRLTRADAHLDWAVVSAAEADRRVRALNPWPGVAAELAGAAVHLLEGIAVAGAPGREATAGQVTGVEAPAPGAVPPGAKSGAEGGGAGLAGGRHGTNHGMEGAAGSGAISGSGDQRPAQPGQVIGVVREGVLVGTREGVYRVDLLKPAGGRPMTGAAFLRGRRRY